MGEGFSEGYDYAIAVMRRWASNMTDTSQARGYLLAIAKDLEVTKSAQAAFVYDSAGLQASPLSSAEDSQ